MNKIDELFDLILDKIYFIEITINRIFLKKFKKEYNGINFYYTSDIKDLVYIIRKTLIFSEEEARNYVKASLLDSPLGMTISPLKASDINIVYINDYLQTINPQLRDEVFYHEIGHIVCGHNKAPVDIDNINFQYEREADNYSKSILGLSKLTINDPNNSKYIAEITISILKKLINDYINYYGDDEVLSDAFNYIIDNVENIYDDIRSQIEKRA